MKSFPLCFILLLSSGMLTAQHVTLRGEVKDRAGQPVFAANLYIKNHPQVGTTSGLDGKFVLTAGPEIRTDTLVVSFIGYLTFYLPVNRISHPENLIIILEEEDLSLTEIVVKANPSLSKEFSLKEISRMDIYNTPSAAGDILKMVTALPASTNTSESANPELRGSSADMSRVILNEVPIYKPVRNTQLNGLGNFSLFNTEMMEEQNVYAGNPPLIYGNSTAGLVDLQTTRQCPAAKTQFALSLANLGIFRSQPAGRHNFLQIYGNYQFSGPYLFLNCNQKSLKHFSSEDLGLNFHRENQKGFSFNIYSYLIHEKYQATDSRYNYSGKIKAGKRRNFTVLNLKYRKNRTFFSLNNGWDFSRENYRFGNIFSRQSNYYNYSSADVKQFFRSDLYIQTGISYEYSHTGFHSRIPTYDYATGPNDPSDLQSWSPVHHALEMFGYVRWNPLSALTLGAGIRKNIPWQKQSSHCSWQINLRYNPAQHHSLLFACGDYNGYSSPTYFIRDYAPVSSRQYSLEYRYKPETLEIALAAYYKKENHTVYFQENDQAVASPNRIAGIEVSVNQNWERLTCSASYTYLYSRIKKEDSWYDSYNRMNYFLKVYATYNFHAWGNVSLSGTFRPGLYYTPIVESDFNPAVSAWIPYYGSYNSARYPAYATIDLTYNKVFLLSSRGYLVLFATINNLFDRANEAEALYSPDYSVIRGYDLYSRRSVYFGIQLTI